MLTENDIISILSNHLEADGYKIEQALKTDSKGIDIIAHHKDHLLYVEAKGETSSKQNTKRYGKTFTGNQIASHVSRAILSSMLLLDKEHKEKNIKVAIALPDNSGHRNLVSKILRSLKTLNITIFWVSETGVIEQ